jgi:hypothetical protein
MANLISVPISKCGQSFDVDLDLTPDQVYKYVLMEGFKSLMSRGLTKFVTRGLVGEELEAIKDRAIEHVEATIKTIYDGTVRMMGVRKTKTGIPRAVMTEAMKQAREAVKVILRKKKIKLSTVKASELTKAAQAFLEATPQLLKDAQEVVRRREEADFDVSSIQVDEVLSAKQAGKPTRRVQA